MSKYSVHGDIWFLVKHLVNSQRLCTEDRKEVCTIHHKFILRDLKKCFKKSWQKQVNREFRDELLKSLLRLCFTGCLDLYTHCKSLERNQWIHLFKEVGGQSRGEYNGSKCKLNTIQTIQTLLFSDLTSSRL